MGIGVDTSRVSDSTNPKDLIGEKKAPLWLIPGPALIVLSWVMSLGARKYGPYNWRQQKIKLTVYLAAAQRHILSCLDGEWIDPESGHAHLGHAMACAAIVLDAHATGNLIDDRPPAGVSAKLIAETMVKDAPTISFPPMGTALPPSAMDLEIADQLNVPVPTRVVTYDPDRCPEHPYPDQPEWRCAYNRGHDGKHV